MKNEGWTLADLAGELIEYGVDIDDIPISVMMERLKEPSVEIVAKEIYHDLRD